MKREKNDYKIGELLNMFEQQKTIKKGLTKLRIMEFWEAEMGHAINTATKKIVVTRDKVIIETASASLRQELSFSKELLLTRFNELAGGDAIKEVVIR